MGQKILSFIVMRTIFSKSQFQLFSRKKVFGNRFYSKYRYPIIFSSDVITAKKNQQPIVALESTIITHGMPYPHNLETALKIENIIKQNNAVPATIGILNGKIHVGIDYEQLEILSKAEKGKTLKCSRRDIPLVISQGLNGGTTVSATMLIAHMADILIMATGGIGGVHRDVKETYDISTDLIELSRTPVAVVCSGVKSILDVNKTLEFLETQGVPVVTIGETEYFPFFYCTKTADKLKSPCKISSTLEAASVIEIHNQLRMNTGILMAVPIPPDDALQAEDIESTINTALETASSKNITGKNITPFILKELDRITKGQTTKTNKLLIENNAKVAAEIALHLNEKLHNPHIGCNSKFLMNAIKQNPVVVGGAVFDTNLCIKDAEITVDGTTHRGYSRHSCGGVARNVADALITLGLDDTRLISIVGNDEAGDRILKSVSSSNDTIQKIPNISTAKYTAILDVNGECKLGIGEMEAFDAITVELIEKFRLYLESANIIVLDGNLPTDSIALVLRIASESGVPVWYEPTDVRKAAKIFQASSEWRNVVRFISPNKKELLVVARKLGITEHDNDALFNKNEVKRLAEQLVEHIPVVITSMGSEGVLVSRRGSEKDLFLSDDGNIIERNCVSSRLYPPYVDNSREAVEKLNVSGCGDCLAAGIIYGIHNKFNELECVSLGLKAAALSLKSFDPVPRTLTYLTTGQGRE